MSSRSKLSAAILTVALLVATGGPLFAAHRVCEAKQHECGTVLRLTLRCCCGDGGDLSDQAGIPQARSEITAPVADFVFVLPALAMPITGAYVALVETSPPPSPSHNLPILFSDLRL
jgi:hypothetical protein